MSFIYKKKNLEYIHDKDTNMFLKIYVYHPFYKKVIQIQRVYASVCLNSEYNVLALVPCQITN